MIEIKGLKKTFGRNTLFDDFNLSIKEKEFVVFSGKSGCGKTTLLNIISSIEEADEGEILVDGIDIRNKKNQNNYFKTKLGLLFQNFALIENKTVLENLNIVKKESKSGISPEQALREVDLIDKINQKVYKLSGGEQQRVALARLMVKKCDLILADEPTGSLDKENANIVIEILKKMNKEGKTILMVTHDEGFKKIGSRVVDL